MMHNLTRTDASDQAPNDRADVDIELEAVGFAHCSGCLLAVFYVFVT